MATELQPYQESQPFNPGEHIMQIKSGKGSNDYLPVQWRLVWFREKCPQGTIDTEEIVVDLDKEFEAEAYVWNADTRRSEKTLKRAPGYARFRAIVTDGRGGRATATKTERGVDFPDFVEKAETGAIGRALAALGYGTQFAPELNEEHRIVDAPVERSEDDKKSYRERKPFVEGSVAQPLHNADGSPVVVLKVMDVFDRGIAAGRWTKETFYQEISAILGKKVTQQNVRTLTQKELVEIDNAIEAGATMTGAN
jgi:hypothetical protein